MTPKIILRFGIAFLVVSHVFGDLRGDSSAICRRTISVRQSRYVPYLETYKQRVWGISFRIRTRTNFKSEYHTSYTTEAVCCDGYQNSGGTCMPICSHPCTNGKCVKPDTCECDHGYVLDTNGKKCNPICAIACQFGQCTTPETCTCHDGYQLTTNKYTCEPMCSRACDNGYCAHPNVCECNSGYRKNDDNKCDPICERPCLNGQCVAPDSCTCNDGFQQSQDDVFTCEPKCSNPCVFGSCTAPNTCTCDSGYELSSGSIFNCTPVCNETCIFGSCIAPDTCSCNDGYALTPQSNYICEPVCEEECEHGKCVGPNACECLAGYVKSFGVSSNGSRCEPHCNDSCINGVCSAPNNCTCNSGFRYNSTTTNCDPVCTKPCVNGFCKSPETCVCLVGYAKSSADLNVCEAICENCFNGVCKVPGKCICNKGYVRDETDNKTCTPTCEPKCIQGACSAMGCSCDFGWGGDSCGTSLLCFVNKPFNEVYPNIESDTINELKESNGTIKVADNPRSKLDRPACNARCLLKINRSTLNVNKTSTNEVRYLFPVDSPCNILVAQATISKTYISVIGAVVGALLCAMVVYSLYLVRINKNKKMTINSGSRQCVYKEEMDDECAINSSIGNFQSL